MGVSVSAITSSQQTANILCDNSKETVKIGIINATTETFCTKWNDNLYVVNVYEDSKERCAWLFRYGLGVQMMMWGEETGEHSKEMFLDYVFSNLPYYIDDYEEEYGEE